LLFINIFIPNSFLKRLHKFSSVEGVPGQYFRINRVFVFCQEIGDISIHWNGM